MQMNKAIGPDMVPTRLLRNNADEQGHMSWHGPTRLLRDYADEQGHRSWHGP